MQIDTTMATFGLVSVVALNTLPIFPYDGILAKKEISLHVRYDNAFVNEVFSDNILLNLAYMGGKVGRGDRVNWEEIRKPQTFSFTLAPGETFAFHEDVLEAFSGKVGRTTNAHFNYEDGFRNSGYLFGDGVCHLASLIYWAAKETDLEVVVPTNHDFREIPQIPREYGVSIYFEPGNKASNARQNLYVTNNREKQITFTFDYNGETLTAVVSEAT